MANATIYLTNGAVQIIADHQQVKESFGILFFYDESGKLQLAVSKDSFSHMILQHDE